MSFIECLGNQNRSYDSFVKLMNGKIDPCLVTMLRDFLKDDIVKFSWNSAKKPNFINSIRATIYSNKKCSQDFDITYL